MHPDDELKSSFAELHRRQRERAPAFAPMREQALRKVNEPRASAQDNRVTMRLAWTGAACGVAVVIWWTAKTSWHDWLPRHHADTKENVEKLITAIEQHLEDNDMDLDYPTDLLLVENHPDYSQ